MSSVQQFIRGSDGRKALAVILLVCVLLPGCASSRNSPQAQRQENAKQDLAAMSASLTAPKAPARDAGKDRPPSAPAPLSLSAPLSLEQAVAFALEHNLEALVLAQEQKVRSEMATGAMYRLLPALLLDADTSRKSWDVASTSVNAVTREVSLEPSISTELSSRTANVTLSWDMLNLAVNTVRWQQARERTRAAGERLRRIKQDIVLSVTKAFLKAQVAKDAMQRATALLADIKNRQQIIAKQIAEGSMSRLDGLQNASNMTEMTLRLKTYSNEYRMAMAELAELLGVKAENGLAVADIDLSRPAAMPAVDLAAFEKEAVRQRPELFQLDAEQNISLDEANAALMQMFPSVTPYAKYSYDSNKYLSRNDWYFVGVRLSWDLFSTPRVLYDRFTAQQQAQLAVRKRMRITLAVTTQIKLSVIECQEAFDRLQLSKQLEEQRREVLAMMREQVRLGKLKESLLLDEDQRYLNARLQHLSNYSGLIAARARLDNSLGRDWNTGRSPEVALPAAGQAQSPNLPTAGRTQPVAKAPQALRSERPTQAPGVQAATPLGRNP